MISGGIAHEKAGVGFGLFKLEDGGVILIHLGEERHVLFDIRYVPEGILCQQDGELGLGADGGPQRLRVEQKVFALFLDLQVGGENLVGQPVLPGEIFAGDGGEGLPVML